MKARLQEGARRKGQEERDAKSLLCWGISYRAVEGSEEKQNRAASEDQANVPEGWFSRMT